MTVGEALRHARSRLALIDPDSAGQEARWLLGHTLKKSATWLSVHASDPVGSLAASDFDDLITRRLQREPLSYLLGDAEFCGRKFLVDRRVLVPRPETEELLELAVARIRAEWPDPTRSLRIVDVGTGSGILAISLALAFPSASITGCDISEPALDIARRNVGRFRIEMQVSLVHSDLLAGIESPIDVLIANLPYVNAKDLELLEPEVQCEPRVALDGGVDGFDLYRRLFWEVANLAQQPSPMFFEIGSDQGQLARSVAEDVFPQYQVEIIRDLRGHERFVVVTQISAKLNRLTPALAGGLVGATAG